MTSLSPASPYVVQIVSFATLRHRDGMTQCRKCRNLRNFRGRRGETARTSQAVDFRENRCARG
jgi:hypothetical protein